MLDSTWKIVKRFWAWLRRALPLLLAGAASLAVLFGYSVYQSKYELTCSVYTLTSEKLTEPVRVLQITDLHNSVFGEGNARLLALCEAQEPDAIFITGDLLNSDVEDTSIATDLISALAELAPVYVSYGNHELEHEERFGTDILSLYEAAGATVLDSTWVDTELNGQQVRIGGLYGYCLPARYLLTGGATQEECKFLSAFQNTNRYTLLLCHLPSGWLLNGGLDGWSVDCVFSGHVHGGEIILPLIGGLYAPDFGWFPGKLEGVYFSDNGTQALVLSRGLGTTEWVPRVNNIPEVVVVDFTPRAAQNAG